MPAARSSWGSAPRTWRTPSFALARSAPPGRGRGRRGLRERVGLPMERGVYFDAWFPGQHNYHPSFPPRRLRMIDHLEDYRATMLVWAALGGGNLALPYLEEEAFGEVPPRYRVYGFLSDCELIAECALSGLDV